MWAQWGARRADKAQGQTAGRTTQGSVAGKAVPQRDEGSSEGCGAVGKGLDWSCGVSQGGGTNSEWGTQGEAAAGRTKEDQEARKQEVLGQEKRLYCDTDNKAERL